MFSISSNIIYAYVPLIQPVVTKIKVVKLYEKEDEYRKVESNLGTNIDLKA